MCTFSRSPRPSRFSHPFHSFCRSPRSDLSISISHSLLPFLSVSLSAFSSPLSSSTTYLLLRLLHLLRLSSFSFLVQLAIPRSGETSWKLSFSHALRILRSFVSLPSAYLTLLILSLLSLSLCSLNTNWTPEPLRLPAGSRMHAHAPACVYLTCTCTHADSVFHVLASADKSRWRLCVGDGEREAERGKKGERERETE